MGTSRSRDRWDVRIRRIEELCEQYRAIAPALEFYRTVLEWQSGVACRSMDVIDPAVPLRQQIDQREACIAMDAVLALAARHGTALIHDRAIELQHEGEGTWTKLLRSTLDGEPSELTTSDEFFVRACLQPLSENLQLQLPKDPNYILSVCPACGSLPQMAVLRPEGEGASRSLLCSLCLCEWTFRRIVCPCCGEEDREKLPHYSSDSCAYVHVEACDSCRKYLKAIDLSIDGLAVPLVDEAALAVLDVWATGHGYTKIVLNLIGF